MEVKFLCIQVCPELDSENLKHCKATKKEIIEKEQSGYDCCPCGNIPIWEEYKEES